TWEERRKYGLGVGSHSRLCLGGRARKERRRGEGGELAGGLWKSREKRKAKVAVGGGGRGEVLAAKEV
ncbi:unnamed protein product, partial [Ectocarpus sp. 6 AP-2014]